MIGPLMAGLAGAFLLWEMREPPPLIDDAYISFRYARNLVEGHGLVWNPGERVEGFTTLLWTLLIALGLGLGAEAERVAQVLSVVSGVATLGLCYLVTSACLPARARAWAGLSPWLLLSSVAFTVWTRSGLETPLLAALTTWAAWAALVGRPWHATAAVGLAILTRPDAVLLAPPLLAWGLGTREPPRVNPREILHPASALFALLVALTAFRLAYYGSPVPNTFYAKVGGIPWHVGFVYVLDLLLAGVLLWLPLGLNTLAPPSAVDGPVRARRLRLAWLGFPWFGLYSLYCVWVGGDAFMHSRFFVGVLPTLAALAVIGVRVAAEARGERSAAHLFALACLLGLSLAAWLGAPARIWIYAGLAAVSPFVLIAQRAAASGASKPAAGPPGDKSAAQRPGVAFSRGFVLACGLSALGLSLSPLTHGEPRLRRLSRSGLGRLGHIEYVDRFHRFTGLEMDQLAARLRQLDPVPSPIASVAIGRLGYRLPARVIDLLGLTEPEIARFDGVTHMDNLPGHHRSNAAHVLAQQPEMILLPGEKVKLVLPAVRDIRQAPVFKRSYVFDPVLKLYRRKSAEGGGQGWRGNEDEDEDVHAHEDVHEGEGAQGK